MADDGEGSITLNLNTGEGRNEEQHRKRKADSEDEEPTSKMSKKRFGNNANKSSTNKSSDDQKEFISSLFNHNPEVPDLKLDSGVSALHETIFTSKDFTKLGLHPYLTQNLDQWCQIKQMTSVQAMAIPIILSGKDALIKSQTGSGKTLAFALPIIHALQEIRPEISRQDGVHALIIVPTRELAIQCMELFEKLCNSFARIIPGILSGGEKKKSEKARLRKGINILVATPGRLIDHLQHTKCLSLTKLKFLVLDEADRMLELGYERDVQTIITFISEQTEGNARQTLLLSATLTTGIEQLSEVSMKHPKFIDAAVDETDTDLRSLTSLTTPENLNQTFSIVPAKLRLVCLAAFVLWKCKFNRARKMLIFMSTQDMVDFHSELFDRCLNNLGEEDSSSKTSIPLMRLHGSMNHKDRTQIFSKFRESTSGVLFCTDVAARGLDLPQVDWIVQYNPPTTKADYVHRVGRTARIGSKGSSLLFLLPSEAGFVKELEEEKLILAEMTVDQILTKLYKNGGVPGSARPFSMEEAATNLQMKMENVIASDNGLHERACQAYVSYIRSYAAFPREARDTFAFKELHLGHIAKSYALRDPPTKITGIGKGQWVQNAERQKKNKRIKSEENIIKAQKKRINQKALVMSEYSSGFEGMDLSHKPVKNFLKSKRKRE